MQMPRFCDDSPWQGFRNRSEGPAHEIGVQSRQDDLLSAIGELTCNVDQFGPQKICLVHTDYLRTPIEGLEDIGCVVADLRSHSDVAMGDNLVVRIARIDRGLEYFDPLSRDYRATQPAHQLFALTGEHRTANHLDPTHRASYKLHVELRS